MRVKGYKVTNKYKAKKTEVDGIMFDSKKEAERYKVLKSMQDSGEISGLELQKKFRLVPPQEFKDGTKLREMYYKADFFYYRNGTKVVEDVKGWHGGAAYNIFKMKQKLMLFILGVEVHEV